MLICFHTHVMSDIESFPTLLSMAHESTVAVSPSPSFGAKMLGWLKNLKM